MKIISWNLNGLLSAVKNKSLAPIEDILPDIICLQEIRTQQEPVVIDGYEHFWNHGERDGYSGTAILSFDRPQSVRYGFDGQFPEPEGRLITLELADFYLVNAYVPNSQKNLKRHAYRMEWDECLREYAMVLREDKPVIICGDFNVPRESMDIYEENIHQILDEEGYTSDERSNMETLLETGFTDVFRSLYPEKRSYTWWSNRLHKRDGNQGWRLDYFLVSDELMPSVIDVRHLSDIYGSDHCPIELEVQ